MRKLIIKLIKKFHKCKFDEYGYCKFCDNVRPGSKAERHVMFYDSN